MEPTVEQTTWSLAECTACKNFVTPTRGACPACGSFSGTGAPYVFTWRPPSTVTVNAPRSPVPWQVRALNLASAKRQAPTWARQFKAGKPPLEAVRRRLAGMVKGRGLEPYRPSQSVRDTIAAMLEKGKEGEPITFLTNKDTHKVFPVFDTSDPKAKEAISSPKHRDILTQIAQNMTGTRGGDYQRHDEHLADVLGHENAQAVMREAGHTARAEKASQRHPIDPMERLRHTLLPENFEYAHELVEKATPERWRQWLSRFDINATDADAIRDAFLPQAKAKREKQEQESNAAQAEADRRQQEAIKAQQAAAEAYQALTPAEKARADYATAKAEYDAAYSFNRQRHSPSEGKDSMRARFDAESTAFDKMEAAREAAKIEGQTYALYKQKSLQYAQQVNDKLTSTPSKTRIAQAKKDAEWVANYVKREGIGKGGGKSRHDVESDFGVSDVMRRAYPDLFEPAKAEEDVRSEADDDQRAFTAAIKDAVSKADAATESAIAGMSPADKALLEPVAQRLTKEFQAQADEDESNYHGSKDFAAAEARRVAASILTRTRALVDSKDPNKAKEALHAGNQNMRKVFQAMTGVSLGKTAKEADAAIAEWAGRPAQKPAPTADDARVTQQRHIATLEDKLSKKFDFGEQGIMTKAEWIRKMSPVGWTGESRTRGITTEHRLEESPSTFVWVSPTEKEYIEHVHPTLSTMSKGSDVAFLTNKETHKVFPVSPDDPKAKEALASPKHASIVATVLAHTSGERGGDYTKHVSDLASSQKDAAATMGREAFRKHVASIVESEAKEKPLGAALRSDLEAAADKVHAEHGRKEEPAKPTETAKPGETQRQIIDLAARATPYWKRAEFAKKHGIPEDAIGKLDVGDKIAIRVSWDKVPAVNVPKVEEKPSTTTGSASYNDIPHADSVNGDAADAVIRQIHDIAAAHAMNQDAPQTYRQLFQGAWDKGWEVTAGTDPYHRLDRVSAASGSNDATFRANDFAYPFPSTDESHVSSKDKAHAHAHIAGMYNKFREAWLQAGKPNHLGGWKATTTHSGEEGRMHFLGKVDDARSGRDLHDVALAAKKDISHLTSSLERYTAAHPAGSISPTEPATSTDAPLEAQGVGDAGHEDETNDDASDAEPPRRSLAELNIKVTPSMTTPSKPGKAPRQVYTVSGALLGHEETLRELGGHQYRGQWSFWNDPTEKLEKAIARNGRMSFADRLDAQKERAGERAERLEERSGKHQATSDALWDKSRRIGDAIPFGQPIMVGHHSEGRHRRDIERITSASRKSIQEQAYAEHLAGRAEYNRNRAEGNHSMSYMSNRLKEAETEIARLERDMAGEGSRGWDAGDPETAKRLQPWLDEYKERAEYWKGKIADAGGMKYQHGDIQVGDTVRRGSSWLKVIKANPTGVEADTGNTYKNGLGVEKAITVVIPYHQVKEHKPMPQEERQALKAEQAKQRAERSKATAAARKAMKPATARDKLRQDMLEHIWKNTDAGYKKGRAVADREIRLTRSHFGRGLVKMTDMTDDEVAATAAHHGWKGDLLNDHSSLPEQGFSHLPDKQRNAMENDWSGAKNGQEHKYPVQDGTLERAIETSDGHVRMEYRTKDGHPRVFYVTPEGSANKDWDSVSHQGVGSKERLLKDYTRGMSKGSPLSHFTTILRTLKG